MIEANSPEFNRLLSVAKKGMSGIGITFDHGDVKRWMGALNRLESRVRYQANNVPRLQAIDYYQLVVRNIMTQKHMSRYPRYHPKYQAWKAQHGRAQGFWKLFGDLVQSLVYQRAPIAKGRYSGQYAWFSGVPAGVKDSGGKSWRSTSRSQRGQGRRQSSLANRPKEIAWYGAIMERGSTSGNQNHPARPVFEPTLNEYKSSGFTRRGTNALISLRRYWR